MPRLRALRIVAAIGLVVTALSVVVPMAFAAEETTTVPATPVCPSGASYNSSTGVCERPAILDCTAGLTPSGDQCVAPGTCPPGSTAPDRGTCTDPSAPNGPLMTRVSCPANSQAIGNSSTCTASPTFTCPAGQTLQGGNLCVSAATWKCPPGGTLSGKTCTMPVKAAAVATAPVAAPAAPTGRPSTRGLQLAATGSTRTQPALGVAGWAFALGGVLLLVAAEPLRRRTRQTH
jgi:hypothetical protein